MPSSRTKKDISAKSPEVSTTSGFFCAQFLKSEKKISKRVLAKSVDLNLYARDFGPLFRSFFGKAARFCSRQNVEFRPACLLVLPNTHSKHSCQRVSQLCDVSDVKTAGKPPPAPGRNHSVLAMLGREKAKHPLPVQRVVVYLLALSRASVFNVTPIMSLSQRHHVIAELAQAFPMLSPSSSDGIHILSYVIRPSRSSWR